MCSENGIFRYYGYRKTVFQKYDGTIYKKILRKNTTPKTNYNHLKRKCNFSYLSNAIAVIENVDRKMLNPCKLSAILQKGRLNGQKTYRTVYKVVGAEVDINNS